jgi:hypothetical protein
MGNFYGDNVPGIQQNVIPKVDSSAFGSGFLSSYSDSFVSGDWSDGGTYYFLNINHGLNSNDVNVTLWEDDSTNLEKVEASVYQVSKSVNSVQIRVSKTPDSRFDGTVVVSCGNSDSSAIEDTARTIYLDPAGNDVIGDGSSGSPFFSLHRAFKDIKPLVAAEIIIEVADGNYNYSALGDCLASYQTVIGGSVTIKSSHGTVANNYSVIAGEGGTFTSNDANEFVHTNSGKAYTANEFIGKFVHPTSMISGTLPTGDQSYYPVAANDTTTITTSAPSDFVSGYDWANYDIVELNINMNFGTNDIIFSGQNEINTTFEFLEITCNKLASLRTFFEASSQKMYFNNCQINGTVVSTCSANRTGFYCATTMQAFFFTGCACIANFDGACISFSPGKEKQGAFYHCVFNQLVGSNNRDHVSSTGIGVEFFTAHSINGKSFIKQNYNGYVSFSGKISHDGTLKFMVQTTDRDFMIKDVYADLYGGFYALNVINEPTTGRLTYDGSSEASEYNNIEKKFSAMDIAPASQKITYTNNDIEITDKTKGIIMTTPDGTKRYRITIDNSGNLITTLLP